MDYGHVCVQESHMTSACASRDLVKLVAWRIIYRYSSALQALQQFIFTVRAGKLSLYTIYTPKCSVAFVCVCVFLFKRTYSVSLVR